MRFIVHKDGNNILSEKIIISDYREFFIEEPLEEKTLFGFTLEDRPPDTDLRLSIGDNLLPEPKCYGKNLEWEEAQYLSNSFDKIHLLLDARQKGADTWKRVFLTRISCYPSKLTRTQFRVMLRDIATISKSLILDIVSKASSSLEWISSKSDRDLSGIEEHLALDQLLNRFEPLLHRINIDPGNGLNVSNSQQLCYGHEHFSSRALLQMTRKGFDPRKKNAKKPFQCQVQKKEITFDIWENRQIAAFCRSIAIRASLIASKAQIQIDTIKREKQWRKNAPKGRISLWDIEDAPRIEQLERSADTCRKIQKRVSQYPQRFGFLGGVSSVNLNLKPTPKFLQDLFYAHAYSAMIRFRGSSGVMFDKGLLEQKLKDTSKLYEYWIFILLFFYLKQHLCLIPDSMSPILHAEGNHDAYVLNLNSGDNVVFLAPNGLRIALHYEPVFFPRPEADKIRSRFYRDILKGRDPLVPDIYIELLSGKPAVPKLEYGIIIDCKYSSRILARHWSDIEKYQSQLFESIGGRNVTDQLWIIYPGEKYGWQTNLPETSLEALIQKQNGTVHGKLSLAPIKSEKNKASIESLFNQIDDSIGKIIRSMISYQWV